MTDEKIQAAQRILEGKCWHCDTLLPAHLIECPLNPNKDILDRIHNIQAQLDKKLNKIKELIDQNNITVTQLAGLLDDIKLNKLQEEEE